MPAARAAAREILDHARREGATRPAFVGPDANSGWGVLPRAEFLAWCEAHELPGITRGAGSSTSRWRSTRRCSPTAACGTRDRSAGGVLRGHRPGRARRTRALGRAPGTDVLLACCGEGRTLSAVTPTVTGVDMRPRELGLRCAQLLLRLIEEDESPAERTTVVPARVRWRESTARREALRTG